MSQRPVAGDGVRTIVHLMRHGEVHNPDGILYGRLPDYHLSDLGQEMAQVVADELSDHDVSLVVASSLDRAQETATPIAAAHGLPILTDDRLIEAGNRFEGRTFGVGAGALTNPRIWPLLRDPFTPSWGEPYDQIATRMLRAIEAARAHAEGHEAVLVSHQLPVWTVRSQLSGQRLWHDPRRRQCSLASLTTLTYLGTELEALSYSEPAAHLLARASSKAGA